VFVLDPHFTHSGRVAPARMTFLFDALADLHGNLQKRSSALFCLQGNPELLLPQLFKQWDITRLAYEFDGEPYARSRDQRVSDIAAQHGVDVVVRYLAAASPASPFAPVESRFKQIRPHIVSTPRVAASVRRQDAR
jgi:deoxyribodipyrimidine photolyase